MLIYAYKRNRYSLLVRQKLRSAHVSFYHAYFLHADLTELPNLDTDLEVRIIEEYNELPEITEKKRASPITAASQGTLAFGAFHDNECIGFICVNLNTAYIQEIRKVKTFDGVYLWFGHVTEKYRRHGVGTALVNKTLHILSEQYAVVRAYGFVETDNVPSLRMIGHSGFQPYERVFALGLGRFFMCKEQPLTKKEPQKTPALLPSLQRREVDSDAVY